MASTPCTNSDHDRQAFKSIKKCTNKFHVNFYYVYNELGKNYYCV